MKGWKEGVLLEFHWVNVVDGPFLGKRFLMGWVEIDGRLKIRWE